MTEVAIWKTLFLVLAVCFTAQNILALYTMRRRKRVATIDVRWLPEGQEEFDFATGSMTTSVVDALVQLAWLRIVRAKNIRRDLRFGVYFLTWGPEPIPEEIWREVRDRCAAQVRGLPQSIEEEATSRAHHTVH